MMFSQPAEDSLHEREPLVSVVMPCYNAEDTVKQAVSSVTAQIYQNWELIIVDDRSTDCSYRIVQELAETDVRIRLFRTRMNSGSPGTPRNEGVRRSRGNFVAFLDADDLWKPDKLTIQIDRMRRTGAALSATAYDVEKDGAVVAHYYPRPWTNYGQMLRQNSIGCSTAVINVAQLGKREFPTCGHEDYALWLGLTREGHTVLGLQESLAVYRLSRNSASSNKIKTMGYLWHIYRHRIGQPAPAAAVLTMRYALVALRRYARTPDRRPTGISASDHDRPPGPSVREAGRR